MRRALIRGGAAIVLLAGVWYFASRWCALAVDQVYTPRLAIVAAAPGDTVSAALDRSLLAWPTPLFQVNFMTGYVPSWQRNLYYRLSWAKASGARLDILWRLRQDYDGINGWTGGRLTDLIRIEIRPAAGPSVTWVETGK